MAKIRKYVEELIAESIGGDVTYVEELSDRIVVDDTDNTGVLVMIVDGKPRGRTGPNGKGYFLGSGGKFSNEDFDAEGLRAFALEILAA